MANAYFLLPQAKKASSMEVSWLEDFLELARAGNFSRAAELRHLTQPAFSRRIRALEDWAGVSLFDRSAQPIVLTEAGRRFQPLADALLHDIAQAREEARRAGAAGAATLRFAATHALSLIFFSDWLKQLEDHGSPWTVHLSSDSLHGCETLLLDGKVQFLLCHAHAAVANRLPEEIFASLPIGDDVLLPCATPEIARLWQPAGAQMPAPERLPLLAYSAESGLGRIFRGVLAASMPALAQPVMTADLAGLLKVLCLDGRGIAWLPRSLIAADLAAERLHITGDAAWRIPLEIRLFRNRHAGAPTMELFWQTLLQHNG
jgi:LysR family transcriptional regulator, hypochlorite-specific transcription factor HypT